MQIDSVAQTATLTTFALFLSSGLTTVSGAPTFSVHSEMRNEPWIQSCGEPVSVTPEHIQERHSVHRSLKRVQTQVKGAQNHFRKELKVVREIYANVTEQLKEQYYSVPWLPEKQFEWYHKEVWCLDKAKKAEVALPKLHDTLQKFAITFYHLRVVNLTSQLSTDARDQRNRTINEMYHEILRMLCEVETAILNLGIKMPSSHKATLVTESRNWANKTDYTRMLVQDSGILRLYRLFLNDWAKALRNATATGSGSCDPTKLKPYESKVKKGGKGRKNQGKNRNGGKRRVGARRQGQGKRNPAVAARNSANGGTGQGRGSRRRLSGNKQKKIL